MNGYQPMTLLRISLYLTLYVWLSNAVPQSVYADPPPSSANAASTPSTKHTPDPLPIGFTYSPKGGILTTVLLNGNTPATFLLDSGFSASCITMDMVKKLGITPQPILGPDGKPFETIVKNALGVSPSMQVGSIPIAHCGLAVVTEDQLHLNALVGQPIDGVIGNNALGFLPCFVDFAKNQVTFLYHLPVTGELLQRLGIQDASACPLTTIKDGGIYVTSVHMINGTHTDDENLAIDLGSDSNILTEQFANQLGLASLSHSRYHTASGDRSLEECLLPNLSFPSTSISLQNQSVSYSTKPLPDQINPCIGRDLLSQFQVLLDFPEKTMYLKPITPSTPAAATSAGTNSH